MQRDIMARSQRSARHCCTRRSERSNAPMFLGRRSRPYSWAAAAAEIVKGGGRTPDSSVIAAECPHRCYKAVCYGTDIALNSVAAALASKFDASGECGRHAGGGPVRRRALEEMSVMGRAQPLIHGWACR